MKPRIQEWERVHNSFMQCEVKLSKLRIEHTKPTHVYLMTINDQQPTFINAENIY